MEDCFPLKLNAPLLGHFPCCTALPRKKSSIWGGHLYCDALTWPGLDRSDVSITVVVILSA